MHLLICTERDDIEAFRPIYNSNQDEVRFAAFDAELEHLFEEQKLPYLSLESFYTQRTVPTDWTTRLARGWYGVEGMEFFTNQHIALGRITEWAFALYISRMLFYWDGMKQLLNTQVTTVSIKAPRTQFPVTAGYMLAHEERVLFDVVQFIAHKSNIAVHVIPRVEPKAKKFVRHTVTNLLFNILNSIVSIVVPPKRIRICVSDHWRNVGTVLQGMKNVEIVLLDRSEIRFCWKYIFSHRIRFVHLSEFETSQTKKEVNAFGAEAVRGWNEAQVSECSALRELCMYHGDDLFELIQEPLKYLVTEVGSILISVIDSAQSLLNHYRIDTVLVRASVSAQPHFPILGLVAGRMNIPSIELQHGLEYWGPDTLSLPKNVSHFIAYGKALVSEYKIWQEETGLVSPLHIHPLGSPRFDIHANATDAAKKDIRSRLGLSSVRRVVLAVTPETGFDALHSYDVKAYYQALGVLRKKHADIELVITFRPRDPRENFYRYLAKTYIGSDVLLDDREPLQNLIIASDIVVANYTTAILEALVLNRAVIVYAAHPLIKRFVNHHFNQTENREFISRADSVDDLVGQITHMSSSDGTIQKSIFLQNYAFDGHATERVRTFLVDQAR